MTTPYHIVQWDGQLPLRTTLTTQDPNEALRKTEELYDTHGPGISIEICSAATDGKCQFCDM